YQHPEDGYKETIEAIGRDDLASFHKKHYGPRGMVIAIVGAVSPEEAREKVAVSLGNWQNPNQPDQLDLPSITPLSKLIRSSVSIPGKTQSDIIIGAAGPKRKAPDFIAAVLGNNILGQFGMMGRIGEAVRERAGLAYYAYSRVSGGVGPGPWSVMAGVNPENVEQAVDLIRQEIRRFTDEPVSDDELRDSQANFIGRLPLALESNSGVSGALLSLERHQLGLDYFQRYAEIINAIKPEDVLHAASHYLDAEKLAITVAGTAI
ncbi:MAG: pitrilysin family protein, partial [Chloroflexota bacterium]